MDWIDVLAGGLLCSVVALYASGIVYGLYLLAKVLSAADTYSECEGDDP